MTTVILKCETLVRLSGVCSFFEPTTPFEVLEKINCVRLENKNGHSFAVSTNQKIAAIEYLGKTEAADGVIHVKIVPEIIESLKKEIAFDSVVNITTIPEIKVSSMQTAFGYSAADCCYWFEDTPMNNWREWISENAEESRQPMYWNLFYVLSLIQASPTGKIVFPEFIDASRPVTLKDVSTDNWVGLFIPEDVKIKDEAKIPTWWNL